MKLVPLLVALAFQHPPARQNPSPMVEHTRSHPRLRQEQPAGERRRLETGSLYIPASLSTAREVPLLVFFHGGTWLPEVAASRNAQAVISIQLGAGSGVYSSAFAAPERFGALLDEAGRAGGLRFSRITLGGWSAGCAAIREIVKSEPSYRRISNILCIDGIHTAYIGGKPGPLESQLETADLEPWMKLARDAIAGRKRVVVTHSEIFPGTFASTTETADYLVVRLGLKREAILRWGPMGSQQLSEVKAGNLLIAGFAGNSAPDHVDQLHSLPDYLGWLK